MTLSDIITVQREGQLVIDMSQGAGTVAGLMRVRAAAGCRKAASTEDPVHISTANCGSDATLPRAALSL